MSEQLPPLSPHDEIDQSFIKNNDWLPVSFLRRDHTPYIERAEPPTMQMDGAELATPQDGSEPEEAIEKILSTSRSGSISTVRITDDIIDPARMVK